MKKQPKKDESVKRECIQCDFGNFIGDVPITGECRRTPPRSFLEGRDGTPGRFFPPVRYDDWCGGFELSDDIDKVNEMLRRLAPYRSNKEKLKLADSFLYKGNISEALSLYESVFESEKSDGGLAFKIAQCYWQVCSDGLEHRSALMALEWYMKSANLGHAEAPFWAGVIYSQGKIVQKDLTMANDYLRISCERGFSRAIKKQESGGFI